MKKLFIMFLSVLLTLCAIAPINADDEYSVKVSAPNGAPALAVATLAVEDPDSYTFVAADTIAAFLSEYDWEIEYEIESTNNEFFSGNIVVEK